MHLLHWFLNTSSQLCEIFKQETLSLKLVTSFTYSSVLSYWLALLENGNKISFYYSYISTVRKMGYIGKMDKLMQVLSNFTHVATACYGLIDMKIAIKIPA